MLPNVDDGTVARAEIADELVDSDVDDEDDNNDNNDTANEAEEMSDVEDGSVAKDDKDFDASCACTQTNTPEIQSSSVAPLSVCHSVYKLQSLLPVTPFMFWAKKKALQLGSAAQADMQACNVVIPGTG